MLGLYLLILQAMTIFSSSILFAGHVWTHPLPSAYEPCTCYQLMIGQRELHK